MFKKWITILFLFGLADVALATEPPGPFDCEAILASQVWHASMKNVKFHDYDQVLTSYVNGELAKPQSRLTVVDAQMVASGFQFFHQVYRHKRTFNGFAGPIDYVVLERHYVNQVQGQAQTVFAEISVVSMSGKAFTPNIVSLTTGALQPIVATAPAVAQDAEASVDSTPVGPASQPKVHFVPSIHFEESLKQAHAIDTENILTVFFSQQDGDPQSQLAQANEQMIQEGFEMFAQSVSFVVTHMGFAGPMDTLLLSRTYVNRQTMQTRLVKAVLLANTVSGASSSTLHIQNVSVEESGSIEKGFRALHLSNGIPVFESDEDVLKIVEELEQIAVVANGRVWHEEYYPNNFNLEHAKSDLEVELPNRMSEENPSEVNVSYQTQSGTALAVALLDSDVAKWTADEYDHMGDQLKKLEGQGLLEAVVFRYKHEQKRADYFEPYYFDIYLRYIVNGQVKGIKLNLHYSLGD